MGNKGDSTLSYDDSGRLSMSQSFNFSGGEAAEDLKITKDLFMLLVQDPRVRKNLDELDVPSDRGHIFDVIDADGSGILNLRRLVKGLLQIRGEARKTDQVACLLAVRALHETLQTISSNQQRLLERDSQIGPKQSWRSARSSSSGTSY